jgi:condensin complex subunit 2
MKTHSIPEETSFHYPDGDDLRHPGETLVEDDDKEEDDDDFDPNVTTTTATTAGGISLKTKKHRKSSIRMGSVAGSGVPSSASKRRRRRSSAQFLRLSPDDEEAEDDESGKAGMEKSTPSMDNLGEVYRKAIRMNAENRINATNSWDLNLIDHLDRFIAPELRSTNMASTINDTLSSATGVNFTKASCTLDASVKIYSYRVDDVHLTSYRVLANLNRTDNKDEKKSKSKETTDGMINEDGATKNQRSGNKSGGTIGDTLEHNLGKYCIGSFKL